MLSVFVIIVFLIVTFSILRFEHTFSRIKLVLILFVLLILISSAITWAGNGNADFSTPRATVSSALSYFSWIKSIGMVVFDSGREGIRIMGNAIQGDINQKRDTFDGRK